MEVPTKFTGNLVAFAIDSNQSQKILPLFSHGKVIYILETEICFLEHDIFFCFRPFYEDIVCL